MLFRRRKKDSEEPRQPNWVMWIAVGFVLIAVITNRGAYPPDSPQSIHHAINQASTQLDPKNFIDVEQYKTRLFPGHNTSLRVKDNTEGKGEGAVCGQEAAIIYSSYLADGKQIESRGTAEKPYRLRLGTGEAMQVFEQGVLGMKPGGTRSIYAPANMAYGSMKEPPEGTPTDSMARFEIELLSVSPTLPHSNETIPLRIMENTSGSGPIFVCGMPIRLHLSMWGVDGKKIYDTREADGKPVEFTLGKSEVFLGLEQGALNMNLGGKRTLIVPPDYQKPLLSENHARSFPFPKNQTVLMDIESVP